MGDTRQVVSEMKKIDDQIQSKEGEIQKYERFVNEVSGHLAKEMEVKDLSMKSLDIW